MEIEKYEGEISEVVSCSGKTIFTLDFLEHFIVDESLRLNNGEYAKIEVKVDHCKPMKEKHGDIEYLFVDQLQVYDKRFKGKILHTYRHRLIDHINEE